MTRTTYGEAARFALPNGLTLYVRHTPRLPVVTILAAVDAGSALDPERLAGVATMTVEALRTGTTEHDEDALADAFADLGTSLRTDRGCDWVDVGTRVLSRDLERGLELTAEALLRPTFLEAKLDRIRSELLAERESSRARADDILIDAFYRILYRGQGYERPVNGTAASLAAITRDDVRRFFAERYGPRATTLALVGDVEPEAAARLVERFFVHSTPGALRAPSAQDERVQPPTSANPALPSGTNERAGGDARPHHPAPSASQALPPSSAGIFFVHKADQSQAHVRIGHRSLTRAHKDWDRLLVANYVLGGAGLSSRITQTVRTQHGLAYSAGSFIVPRRLGGPFAAAAQTKNDTVAKAIALMKDEIEKFRREPLPEADLETARLQFAGSLPFREETVGQKASVLLEGALFDLPPDHVRRQIETAQTISPEDVRLTAERCLDTSRAAIVVVGERLAVLPRLRELGPVQELEIIP